ncbi:MAG: metallophosphoesterase [Planctomycetota bacterium]
MRVFALSDPHLSLGTANKLMDRFGPQWVGHTARMAAAWDELVVPGDLVLVPGDISWARDLPGAAPDLAWLHARPGRKLIVKGNHEHWWPDSRKKLEAALPPSLTALDASAVRVGPVAVCGTRLWDAPGISYHDLILWQGEAISAELDATQAAAALKVYQRELGRLDRALAALDAVAGAGAAAAGTAQRPAALRIVMVHYPPVGPRPEGTDPASELPAHELTERFERAGVQHVIFGHLHSLDLLRRARVGGLRRGVRYQLTACDFIDFRPVLVAEV